MDFADPDADLEGLGGGDRRRIYHARRTLSSLGTVPVAGIALLLGVDRFMSQMRSLTNLIGNGVATIVVAKWERELDEDLATRVLNGAPITANETVEI